jgi:hypothetical protein
MGYAKLGSCSVVFKEVLDVNWWRGVRSVGSDEMVEGNERRDKWIYGGIHLEDLWIL